MRRLFYLVIDLVAPNAKALVAFLVAAFVSFLASKGVEVDGQTAEAGVLFVSGLVTAVLVWLTPNRE